jgi:hypothetical protein
VAFGTRPRWGLFAVAIPLSACSRALLVFPLYRKVRTLDKSMVADGLLFDFRTNRRCLQHPNFTNALHVQLLSWQSTAYEAFFFEFLTLYMIPWGSTLIRYFSVFPMPTARHSVPEFGFLLVRNDFQFDKRSLDTFDRYSSKSNLDNTPNIYKPYINQKKG